MTVNLEKVFFAFILDNKKWFQFVKPQFFRHPDISFVYNIVWDYMIKNTSLEVPKRKQIVDMILLVDKDGKITPDVLKTILKFTTEEFDEVNYIIPKLKTWILINNIKTGTSDLVDLTRNLDNVSDLDSAIVAAEKINVLVKNSTSLQFDDDVDLGTDFDIAEEHSQDSSTLKVKSGWNTMDHILSGGWDVGTLSVYIGMPNSGKCVFSASLLSLRHKHTKEIKNSTFEGFFSEIRTANKK